MPAQSFISKLNWRQMLLQFVGMWLVMYAFMLLAHLRYPDIVEAQNKINSKNLFYIIGTYNLTGTRLNEFLVWVGFSDMAGIICGFVLSLVVCKKRHWFWVNSSIGFILLATLRVMVLTGSKLIRAIMLFGEYRPHFKHMDVHCFGWFTAQLRHIYFVLEKRLEMGGSKR